MAAWRHMKLPFIFTRLCFNANKHGFQVTARGLELHPALRSSVSSSAESRDVDIGVTRDGETIVCFHQAPDISYDLTQPIPRPDLLLNSAESHDLVLKSQLHQDGVKNQKSPAVEELAKMFFTTKHRWYPVGQYHTRRRKRTPPTDR